MPISSVFAAGQLASEYIPLLNELGNGVFTFSSGKNANFAAVKGFAYGLAATGLSVTLPASAATGDRIKFLTEVDTVISVTFLRNGLNINSDASDLTLTGDASTPNVELIYDGATVGWRVVKMGSASGELLSNGTNFNAIANGRYMITAACTATLPASPANMTFIEFFSSKYDVSALVLGRNGSNIESAASDFTVSAFNFHIIAVYVDATIGWALIFDRRDVKKAPTISAGALTLDLERGKTNTFDVSLNAAITSMTISNPPASGDPWGFLLRFTADGTLRAVTWPAAVKWPDAIAPILTSTNGKKDRFYFETMDGGTTWDAAIQGQNL